MVSFSWTSLNLQVKKQDNNLQDTIVSIFWAYSCQEDDYLVFETGRCDLPAPNPLSFIPFQDITKEILIAWVESLTDMNKLQTSLVSKIEAKKLENTYLVQFPITNNV